MEHQNNNLSKLLFTSLIILLIGSITAHAETYTFTSGFGTAGSGDGQFKSATSMALDQSGNIYITDMGNGRVEKFSNDGTYLSQFAINGRYPSGIMVDASGNIYVTDYYIYAPFVKKFDNTGNVLKQWANEVIGDGKAFNPYGIVSDSAGNIYVSDETYTPRIVKFTNDGVFIKSIADGAFSHARGIAVDSSDNIYVADRNNQAVKEYDSSGNLLLTLTTTGERSLHEPNGVAVDASGNIFVADTSNDRIAKFDKAGKFITQWGNHGSNTGQFIGPQSVAVDASGNVYVLDSGNNRIQVFKKSAITISDFTSSAASGTAPLEVKFQDKSENANTWSWDFGDGATSTEQNPKHTYTTGGKYTVKLTATGTSSDIKSKVDYINAVSATPAPATTPVETPTATETPTTTETPTEIQTPVVTETPIVANTPNIGAVDDIGQAKPDSVTKTNEIVPNVSVIVQPSIISPAVTPADDTDKPWYQSSLLITAIGSIIAGIAVFEYKEYRERKRKEKEENTQAQNESH